MREGETPVPVDPQALAATLQTLLLSLDLPDQADDEALITRLDRVIEAAGEVLAVDGAGLMLVDENDVLRVVGTSDAAGEALERGQQALDAGPALDCVRRNATVTVRDLTGPGGYRPLWDWLVADSRARDGGEPPARAVLSVPVRVNGHVAGTLNAFRTEPLEWQPDQVRAVEAYAAIIGTLLRLRAYRPGGGRPESDQG